MIRRCCEIKAGVVERDPKEQGERALLNLGHTIGHAVEKLMDFKLLHGQCVAIGLIAAAKISLNRGLLTEKEYQQIIQGCESYRLPSRDCMQEIFLLRLKRTRKWNRDRLNLFL